MAFPTVSPRLLSLQRKHSFKLNLNLGQSQEVAGTVSVFIAWLGDRFKAHGTVSVFAAWMGDRFKAHGKLKDKASSPSARAH